jgi:hypothetical protein
MFEAIILLVLLGLILWFILAEEQATSAQRTYFIDLSAELKPSAKKACKRRHS